MQTLRGRARGNRHACKSTGAAGHDGTAAIATAGALLLVIASVALLSSGQAIDRLRAGHDNHRLVVANMTADFQYFGLGRQQASMLAQQTADFGTLGEMTTVAAIGMDTGPTDGQSLLGAWLGGCGRSPAPTFTARRNLDGSPLY